MNKFRVGIYLRLSNEDRNKIGESSESIKNQRNLLKQYIANNPNFVLIKEYCDEDLSGAGTYRPEFEKLIKDCENHKLDIVLCKSQSRFSRDMEIIEKYLNNKFLEWNIRFIGLSDNVDTLAFGNKKARQINGLVNEWYLEDVSNNIRSAFNSKMKQGEFISPFAAYGYEISKENNNKLVIDPLASETVKNIFNMYLKGLSFTKIAEYLNNNDIPSPSLYKYKKGIKLNIVSNKPREEIKWNINAVKTILTNELYTGTLVQGKRTTVSYKNHKIIKKPKSKWIKIENTHEAIIDSETFKKVQKIITEKNRPIKKGVIHKFSKKVICLECGSYMRKKTSKYDYLVCSNKECINKSSIRYDKLDEIILKEINCLVKKYYDKNLLNKYLKIKKSTNKIDVLNKQKQDIQNKISKNNNYLYSIYKDKVNDVLTTNQFNYLIKKYNDDEKQYKQMLDIIDKKIKCYVQKDVSFSKFKTLNRLIVMEFIDKIYIGSKKIKIKWNLLS